MAGKVEGCGEGWLKCCLKISFKFFSIHSFHKKLEKDERPSGIRKHSLVLEVLHIYILCILFSFNFVSEETTELTATKTKSSQ